MSLLKALFCFVAILYATSGFSQVSEKQSADEILIYQSAKTLNTLTEKSLEMELKNRDQINTLLTWVEVLSSIRGSIDLNDFTLLSRDLKNGGKLKVSEEFIEKALKTVPASDPLRQTLIKAGNSQDQLKSAFIEMIFVLFFLEWDEFEEFGSSV